MVLIADIAKASVPRHYQAMLKRVYIIAFLGAAGMTVTTARGCSVVSGYRVPTALQLVESADAIVLAKVEAGTIDSKFGVRNARFTPVVLLKGDRLPPKISYEAAISSNRWKAVASDPRNLLDPNPDVFSGACNRQVFETGMLVVAFLKRQGSMYVVHAPPFSRALEDVPSSNAPWVKAIRIYVQIAALPRVKQKGAMEVELARLAKVKNDPDTKLLARDLDRTLHEKR